VLFLATTLLTALINNAAAQVLMVGVGAGMAGELGVSADPFIMAAAVGASCDFLTPFGHQSNTLVMGPGGYRYGDYWRMGLPLTIIVGLVASPVILAVWPLNG
jgi:di/tricarboxylate transporter